MDAFRKDMDKTISLRLRRSMKIMLKSAKHEIFPAYNVEMTFGMEK